MDSKHTYASFVDVTMTEGAMFHIGRKTTSYLESPFHFHGGDVYELVLIEKSTGKRFVGDNISDFKQGDLVLMGPELPHKWINDLEYYEQDSDLVAQTIVLHFNGKVLQRVLENAQVLILFLDRCRRGVLFLGNDRIIISEYLNLLVHEVEPIPRLIAFIRIMEAGIRATDFTLLTSPSYNNTIDARELKRINDVYEFVMAHFQSNISLEEVATIANMTVTAFCRFFKLHNKMTFTDFVNRLRIGHACKELQNKNTPITDICYQSGFNNTANFNKFFKKIMGLTPKMYRSRLNP